MEPNEVAFGNRALPNLHPGEPEVVGPKTPIQGDSLREKAVKADVAGIGDGSSKSGAPRL